MPTIVEISMKVGIYIFIGRENFMLSWDKHENSFITSGPDYAEAMLDIQLRSLPSCFKAPD